MIAEVDRGSFRDPSGFVYTADGSLYRQVNRVFAEEFDACVASGLYDDLTAGGWSRTVSWAWSGGRPPTRMR